MQSEFQVMYADMQELVWLRGVLGKLQLALYKSTLFFLDSRVLHTLTVNPAFHKGSKHIAIKFFKSFIECVSMWTQMESMGQQH